MSSYERVKTYVSRQHTSVVECDENGELIYSDRPGTRNPYLQLGIELECLGPATILDVVVESYQNDYFSQLVNVTL